MKQAALNFDLSAKITCKEVFLDLKDPVVPWAALIELIAPCVPEGKTSRPPFSLMPMLRIHIMQQWFTLSVPSWNRHSFTSRYTGSLFSWQSLPPAR